MLAGKEVSHFKHIYTFKNDISPCFIVSLFYVNESTVGRLKGKRSFGKKKIFFLLQGKEIWRGNQN